MTPRLKVQTEPLRETSFRGKKSGRPSSRALATVEAHLVFHQGQVSPASDSVAGLSLGSSVPVACVFAAASEFAAGVAVPAFVGQLRSSSAPSAAGGPDPASVVVAAVPCPVSQSTGRAPAAPSDPAPHSRYSER